VVNKVKLIYPVAILLAAMLPMTAAADQDLAGEVAALKQQVAEMKSDYEARISDLEQRLGKAELSASGARRSAKKAMDMAEETAIESSGGSSSPNEFNPGIGVILTGRYASFDNGWQAIPGFQPGGEVGTGDSGFELGESELNLQSSVDTQFYANATISLSQEGADVEEAWMQTTGLPAGFTVKGGRFFSNAGYLNSVHAHADDFVDRPLPYQAFLGGQYAVDGVQARWLAPTALLVELGAELDWGADFPATANGESSPGSYTVYAKVGGDVGADNAWQAGLGRISTKVVDRVSADETGEGFTGDSDLTILDFVWKWAPGGNPTIHNFKVQGEYIRRNEDGSFDGIPYKGDQSGWYLQGAWQFRPLWRVGLRYDTADPDSGPPLAGTAIEDPGRSASRVSAMIDYSPSEFSRLRLQYTRDHVLPDTENQWYLQYILSLGAHGAHQF
jgi:hypothetical protein